MAEDGGQHHHWPFYITLTALLLSLLVLGQLITTHYAAFRAAPAEIETFIHTLDQSAQENDSYDRDVNRVQRLDDRMRLERLLQEIQRCTDDLRDLVNDLTDHSDPSRLKKHARIFWALRRTRLEERVRRLDLLRMRFLVVYMGIVASQTPASMEKPSQMPTPRPIPTPPTPPEKLFPASPPVTPKPPPLPKSLTDAILKKPALKKISTAPVTKKEQDKPDHRVGWAGVIAELQKSPLLHKRHASIETAMAEEQERRAATPSSSPLSTSP